MFVFKKNNLNIFIYYKMNKYYLILVTFMIYFTFSEETCIYKENINIPKFIKIIRLNTNRKKYEDNILFNIDKIIFLNPENCMIGYECYFKGYNDAPGIYYAHINKEDCDNLVNF